MDGHTHSMQDHLRLILYQLIQYINIYVKPFHALSVVRSQIPELIRGGSGGMWLATFGASTAAPERPPGQLHRNNVIYISLQCAQIMSMHKD